MSEIIWQPSAELLSESNIARFMQQHGLSDYGALQERAAQDPTWFWDAVVRDLGIKWHQPYTEVMDTSRGLPWTTWFRDGRMNVATDCVDKHAEGERAEQAAVIWEGEEGQSRTWTYRELQAEASRLANGLVSLGIGKGDRVGIFLPMIPEVVAAIMAVAKVGAIFIPIFSGYAAQAVATRLNDGGARLLITANGFSRRGKPVDMKAVADEAVAAAPTVEHVLVVQRVQLEVAWQQGRDLWYDELTRGQSAEFETRSLSAEDPLMLIYTSGTTGKPKGALHVHCGFPIKGAQDMAHCFDVRPGDRMFWFSDIGWMMGPWLIFGTLLLGATCFLFDGAPDFPEADRMWAMVERHQITHLGVSPTMIRALMTRGDNWPAQHDLSSLRILGGTGEPWNPDPYLWFFEKVGKGRAPIINYSGGTEISGGILCCVPVRPLKVASFNCAIAGMAADVVDDQGRSAPIGEVGELVLRSPWPGMTRGFWQDPKRYEEAYWSRFPGIWQHGDWASVDADGFWYIHGRSDDTIKVAGKRLGPAEAESALVHHPAVAEAAAIGVPHEIKGEALVCFVVLKADTADGPALRKELAEQVAADLGKALKPEAVHVVGALPKTRNAKVMRRVIKAAYLGQPTGDVTALENPAAVDEIARVRA